MLACDRRLACEPPRPTLRPATCGLKQLALHHPVRTAQVEARPALAGRASVRKGLYFSWFETAVNVLVNLVPSVVIAAIAATAIRAAMRPYSIAVAPDFISGEAGEECLHVRLLSYPVCPLATGARAGLEGASTSAPNRWLIDRMKSRGWLPATEQDANTAPGEAAPLLRQNGAGIGPWGTLSRETARNGACLMRSTARRRFATSMISSPSARVRPAARSRHGAIARTGLPNVKGGGPGRPPDRSDASVTSADWRRPRRCWSASCRGSSSPQ